MKQISRTSRYTSAYTLIEILVALTIIGILFGFGYVNFRDFSRRQQLAGVVKSVQGDMRLAQQMALSGQKPENCTVLDGVRFEITPPDTYRLRYQCNGIPSDLYREIVLPSGIIITPGAKNPIIFNVLGRGNNLSEGEEVEITLTQTGTNSVAKIFISQGGDIK